MRVVAALGGNALARRGEPPDVEHARHHLAEAAGALARIAREHALVVTHGNGPQVGLLAIRAATSAEAAPEPLDVLGAESEGMIGYLVEQALANCLPGRRVATLLTRVEVAADDPAFGRPTKPIGLRYPVDAGRRLARERGWTMAPEGDGLRRVVPSPLPRRVLEIEAIRLLLDGGAVVVCAGGGGIPVVATGLAHRGVEAVVDKDRASALLAEELGADLLLLLTDVDAVRERWPAGRRIRRASPGALARLSFDPGSMGPKVESAAGFVRRTGRRAVIAALAAGEEAVAGTAGTQVVPGDDGLLELGPG